MVTTAELALHITAKDDASKALDSVGKSAGGLGKTLGDVGKIAGGFMAANVVAAGVQQLTGFIGDSIDAAKESIAVNAQLDAVLKSTGGAAGVTADEVRSMAAEMEKMSVFEDEAIISGQNLLLTFTNIGQEVFPEATQTMLDMSQALGQDMSSSAVQLGKALNDPINGITALSRVGVSFTDQQKEQIEAMVEAGDVAGAQAVILAELNKEFGGSAKAASDAAGASEVYKDKMNDLKEQIGTQMLPVQLAITEAKAKMVDLLVTKVIPVLQELYAKHWPAISAAIQDVVAFIQETWPQIQPIFQFAADFVISKIEGMVQVVKSVIEIVTSVVNLISAIFHVEWSRAWAEMKDIAGAMVDLFVGYIKTQFGNLPEILLGLVGRAADAGLALGKALANGVIRGINGLLSRLSGKELIPAISAPLIGTVTPSVNIPNLGQIGLLARGTRNWRGGLAVVGEQGPELAYLPRGTEVYSNRESQAMAGGPTVTINIDTVVATSREDAQRGANDLGWGLVAAMRARGVF